MTTAESVDKNLEIQEGHGPGTIRLTVAQAICRYLAAQDTEMFDGSIQPLFGGVFGIFGHGNVAGVGEALFDQRKDFQYLRGQNEQGMAHAAIAYAKAHRCRRVMGVTTSIGPGATNLLTAATLAHVNRLPVLLMPGDIFANRRPDPVLQQLEDERNPLNSANSSFQVFSRYYDCITRPEQVIASLPVAVRTMMNPMTRGPVTLALPQDVQTEAFDFPLSLFRRQVHRIFRAEPDRRQVQECAAIIRSARRPLIIAGGGVHYSGATEALQSFVEKHRIPVAETQAGKGSLCWRHEWCLGGVGVTGTSCANAAAKDADVVICVGTRLSDFTTASKTLFQDEAVRFIGINVAEFDACKLQGSPLIGDALRCLESLDHALGSYQTQSVCHADIARFREQWFVEREGFIIPDTPMPTDAQVLAAVNEFVDENATVVCAAGGLPGELHKHWNAENGDHYHLEYGYSCMGYEIAGGLGVKMAKPEREVYVLLGDGSYLMLHTELVTARQLGLKLNVVILDNQGFGCINRLQQAGGSPRFGNLLRDQQGKKVDIDFVANAASYGCHAVKVKNIEQLKKTLQANQSIKNTCVTVIETDPEASTPGTAWWDVALSEVSHEPNVRQARKAYEEKVGSTRFF